MSTLQDLLRTSLPQRRHRSGRYYGPHHGSVSAGPFSQGDLRLCPIVIPEAGLYDRVMCEQTSVGEAGSLIRMGWFATDFDGYPDPSGSGAFADYGTVVATGANGGKEITINQYLPRGVAWFGAVTQLCPTTPPQLRFVSVGSGFTPADTTVLASFSNLGGVWQTTSVTGALAAWATGAATGGTAVPKMWIRRA